MTDNAEVCEIATGAFPISVVRAQYQGTSPITSGSVTTIKEILAQIPDLQNLYEETFDELSLCLPCDVSADPNFDEETREAAAGCRYTRRAKGYRIHNG